MMDALSSGDKHRISVVSSSIGAYVAHGRRNENNELGDCISAQVSPSTALYGSPAPNKSAAVRCRDSRNNASNSIPANIKTTHAITLMPHLREYKLTTSVG
jgi:hypothetical protein